MTRASTLVGLVALAAGCKLPGQPRGISLEGQPAKVEDFEPLYSANCAGCHGARGHGGAALNLDNAVYLAIVDDPTLQRIISEGVPGTAMPAFAESAGGMLTGRQVAALVHGIRTRWAPPAALSPTPPPYAAPAGDVQRGAAVFASACAGCHGSDGSGSGENGTGRTGHGTARGGRGGAKTGSIVDGSYLALVSPQSLRTLVIAGRPDIGQPDWRNDVPGHPLASQEVADVVAWLLSHRAPFPGRPYPASP